VALMMCSNIVQPFSCQTGSPVMRYMYHTDSIASGLESRLGNFNLLENREGCLPKDVITARDSCKARSKSFPLDLSLDVLFMCRRSHRIRTSLTRCWDLRHIF
jgi:hypothetical protein